MKSESYNNNLVKETAIFNFKADQSLSNIQKMKNLGIDLMILKSNKWQPLHEYKLPFERFITLYSDDFKISGIGVY